MNESIPSLVYINTDPHHPLLDENIVKIKQLEKEVKEQDKLYCDLQKFAVELEKENAELKNTIKVFKDENFECGICLDETLENERLRKENKTLKENWCQATSWREIFQDENKDLKSKLAKAEKEALRHKSLAEGHHRLEKRLESKLASIKYLNREEVEKIIFDEMKTDYNFYGVKEAITAICSLAIEIDKEINE